MSQSKVNGHHREFCRCTLTMSVYPVPTVRPSFNAWPLKLNSQMQQEILAMVHIGTAIGSVNHGLQTSSIIYRVEGAVRHCCCMQSMGQALVRQKAFVSL